MAADAFVRIGPLEGSAVAVGGTAGTVAAVLARGAGRTLDVAGVGGLVDRLAELSLEGIAGIDGVPAGRAPVILGGAIVLEAALRAVGAVAAVVSAHDLLDGIALGLVSPPR